MKRTLILTLSLLFLAFILVLFAPEASATPADNYVEITWNGQKYGVDATGCVTWRDYLNTSDANFHGHSVDAYGFVIYYIDLLDLSFRICDMDGNNVKADDPIKDIPYTFNCALFTFGNDIILYKHNIMQSYFFDLTFADIAPEPNVFWEEDDGSISYIGPNCETFAVYGPSGNRVQVNDDVEPIQYTFKLNYAFYVQHYSGGSPSGDPYAFHASVSDWSLGSLAHDNIWFLNADLGTCFVSKYGDYYAFCVDQDEDGAYDKAYFLMTADGALVRFYNSELQGQHYYLIDPCSVNCHNFMAWCVVTPATCLDSGVEGRYCQGCGLYESRELDPLGHDRNWLGTCTRCKNRHLVGIMLFYVYIKGF